MQAVCEPPADTVNLSTDGIRYVGQMMVIGFEETTISQDVRTMIEKYHVGGVHLKSREFEGIHLPVIHTTASTNYRQTALKSPN